MSQEQNSSEQQTVSNAAGQTVIIQQAAVQKNGAGTAGFVLALLGFIFSWVPVLGIILWILGLIFSLVGVFKSPKGLAITGLVITFIGFFILLALFGAIFGSALAFS